MDRDRFWVPAEGGGFGIGEKQTEKDGQVVFDVEVTSTTGQQNRVRMALSLADADGLGRATKLQLEGRENICDLDVVNQGGLEHMLRARYFLGAIYTRVAHIVIAINPNQMLPLYTGQFYKDYQPGTDVSKLPAHIFSIGCDVFAGVDDGRDQAVLISGESGAGKTESTKLVLSYIAEHARGAGAGIDMRIVKANPILEAFGNATTIRNRNSSRFGKFIEVSLANGQIVGAAIRVYLLEVTRVCCQAAGERNYHVFHQLVENRASKYGLGATSDFHYLRQGGAPWFLVDDTKAHDELVEAFEKVGFSQEEQDDIFAVAAGVLHLGNASFRATTMGEDKIDECSCELDPEGANAVARAAELFGVDEHTLARCLTSRSIGDVLKPLTAEAAAQQRDSLAKLIYNKLFMYLVIELNKALLPAFRPPDTTTSVGILDIAGFEIFENNSLEQLLINLSNEKLHQFFNRHIFKTELEDCISEGVDATSIKFNDNQPCLDLIEGKTGLISMLDDDALMARATDATWVAKARTVFAKHSNFIAHVPRAKGKNGDLMFGIKHFAGKVEYSAAGFMTKNIDTPPKEAVLFMEQSSKTVLNRIAKLTEADVFGSPEGGTLRRMTIGGGSAKKGAVSGVYRRSLSSLVERLERSDPHFIRCLKPNDEQQCRTFDATVVGEQLRFTGVLEVVNIRTIGYPMRMSFCEFVQRFILLMPEAERRAIFARPAAATKAAIEETVDFKEAAQGIVHGLPKLLGSKSMDDEIFVAKTKVFIKQKLQQKLEVLRRNAFWATIVRIQTCVRGKLARVQVASVRKIAGEANTFLRRVSVPERRERPTSSFLEQFGSAEAIRAEHDRLEAILEPINDLPQQLISGYVFTCAARVMLRMDHEACIAHEMERLLAIGSSAKRKEVESVLARAEVLDMAGAVMVRLKAFQNDEEARTAIEKKQNENDVGRKQRKEEAFPRIQHEEQEEGTLDGNEEVRTAFAAKSSPRMIRARSRAASSSSSSGSPMSSATDSSLRSSSSSSSSSDQERKSQLTRAMKEYDVKALGRQLDAGSSCKQAMALFRHFHNAHFVRSMLEEEMSTLNENNGRPDNWTFTRVSNLCSWAEYQEMPIDTTGPIDALMAAMTDQRSSQMGDLDPVAAKVFANLSNFKRLRRPQSRKSLFRMNLRRKSQSDGLTPLQWSKKRLEAPLTMVRAGLDTLAIESFQNLLGWMKDWDACYQWESLAGEVLQFAARDLELADEVYVQLMKQLTGNPHRRSEAQGWQLMELLCKNVLPSCELLGFLREFLRGHVKTSIAAMRALNTLDADANFCQSLASANGDAKRASPKKVEKRSRSRSTERSKPQCQTEKLRKMISDGVLAGPGLYIIVTTASVRNTASMDGTLLGELPVGTVVNVLEVLRCGVPGETDARLRARIDTPVRGWISVVTAKGEKVAEKFQAGTAPAEDDLQNCVAVLVAMDVPLERASEVARKSGGDIQGAVACLRHEGGDAHGGGTSPTSAGSSKASRSKAGPPIWARLTSRSSRCYKPNGNPVEDAQPKVETVTRTTAAAVHDDVWMFESENGWSAYSSDVSGQINKALTEGRRSLEFAMGATRYIVDVVAMTQCNCDTKRTGRIRRAMGEEANHIMMLVAMGFSQDQANEALFVSGGDIEAAVKYLESAAP